MTIPSLGLCLSQFGTAIAEHGFDIAQPLSVQAYNASVPPGYAAPDMGRASTLALLIGNTRALWPIFTAAYRAAPALQQSANPLDDYCASIIGDALHEAMATHLPNTRSDVFWAPDPPPRRILLQRAAVAAGLGYLAPSQLCIHPTFGPWFSLRAFIVINADAPGLDDFSPIAPTCDCTNTCQPIINRLAQMTHTQAHVRATWRDYLALRDACPVGRSFRFSDAQLRYHYAHDVSALWE